MAPVEHSMTIPIVDIAAYRGEGTADASVLDPALTGEFVERFGVDLQDESCPPEVRQLGRTITKWRSQIAAWHHAHVSNGPTEAVKQPDQAGQVGGVRVPPIHPLPDPGPALRGRPNWDLLATITPR